MLAQSGGWYTTEDSGHAEQPCWSWMQRASGLQRTSTVCIPSYRCRKAGCAAAQPIRSWLLPCQARRQLELLRMPAATAVGEGGIVCACGSWHTANSTTVVAKPILVHTASAMVHQQHVPKGLLCPLG